MIFVISRTKNLKKIFIILNIENACLKVKHINQMNKKYVLHYSQKTISLHLKIKN